MPTFELPQGETHDLRLPVWGPYNKKYNGIAHIPDLASGLRFELSVFPASYRHGVNVPACKWESNDHPWEAAPGLTYFSYRYELEWRDQVYADVAFFQLPGVADERARVIRCELVNQTDRAQHQAMHLIGALSFPPLRPYSDEPIELARVDLPPGAHWIDALAYRALAFATPRPTDSLVYEGWRRGEIRAHGFVDGVGLGEGFGSEAGDHVAYDLPIDHALTDGVLLVRYRLVRGAPLATFELRGLTRGTVVFEPADDFGLCEIPLGRIAQGRYRLELVSKGSGPIDLDGFVLVERAALDRVGFQRHCWEPTPDLEESGSTLTLRYPDVEGVYGIAWGGDRSEVRQYLTSELDRTFRYFVNEHVARKLVGDGAGHFTDVFIRPVILAPHARQVLYALVCYGTADEVRAQLKAFDPNDPALDAAYQTARAGRVDFAVNPTGEQHLFSQERMAATLLTNVVYPVYTRGTYIRHFTPGKWWDCLYTWDSGFISLGLMSIDLPRAIDCLNAYTTPPGDQQAAFLHHGSPVPVQIYAFHELWNRTQSTELLDHFYPRLRQMYRFLAGRLGSSTTRRMKSGLLKTWDYFYNSAGWDDYVPQVHVHAHGLEGMATPVVTTAHLIRCARLLQQAARAAGASDDVAEYQADIDLWINALNAYAWDDEAGVFSYVAHDEAGQPSGILRHKSGENLNLGFDGVSPLFAGACTPEQRRRLIDRLASPEHLWTPFGLTAIDQSAAYYRIDGYWNGTVWFAYQWFFWKALLDLGEGDLAHKIGSTALNVWRDEVDATFNCFEHIVVETGRGAGWHHFGGLSAPILSWFNAYHTPGALTCGFDTWVESQAWAPDRRGLQASLRHSGSPEPWLALVVLDAGSDYTVNWNGAPVTAVMREPGTLEIALTGSGDLTIRPMSASTSEPATESAR